MAATIALAGVLLPGRWDINQTPPGNTGPNTVLADPAGTMQPASAAPRDPAQHTPSTPPATARPNAAPSALAGGAYFVAEGETVALKGSGADPDGDTLTFSWDLDGDGVFETTGQNVTFSAASLDGPGTQPVTLLVCDTYGACASSSGLVSIANSPPSVGSVKGPSEPLPVGATVGVSVDFTDAGTLDTHAVIWEWGDGTTSPGNVFESGGAGTASGTHTYTKPGEYRIKAVVTDKDGSSADALSPPIRIVERR